MDDEMMQQTPEAVEQTEETTEDQPERLFTAEEVERIVKKRVKRIKAETVQSEESKALAEDLRKREESIAGREKDLKQRETRLNCQQYLFDNHYPMDLLDLIDTSDLEQFIKKADKVQGLYTRSDSQPLANHDQYKNGDDLKDAFKPQKHEPGLKRTSAYNIK